MRAIRSTLDLERSIAARTAARLKEAEDLIHKAAIALADEERRPGLHHQLVTFGLHARPITTTGEP